jgi:hypothetical protein
VIPIGSFLRLAARGADVRGERPAIAGRRIVDAGLAAVRRLKG